MSTTSASDITPRRRRRIGTLLSALLLAGMTPRRLATALTVGAVIGLMPIPWGTSLLCLAAALLLRLPPAVVEFANLAVYPLQIAFFLPFLHLGNRWFGQAAGSVAAGAGSAFMGPFALVLRWAAADGVALAAWGVTVPVLVPPVYGVAKRLVSRRAPHACGEPAITPD